MSMRPRQDMTHLLQDSTHDDRRRHGRIRCATLTTRFGIIEDMSASGMRVTCKGWRKPKIGTILNVDIKHPNGTATVECQRKMETYLIEKRKSTKRVVQCRSHWE